MKTFIENFIFLTVVVTGMVLCFAVPIFLFTRISNNEVWILVGGVVGLILMLSIGMALAED